MVKTSNKKDSTSWLLLGAAALFLLVVVVVGVITLKRKDNFHFEVTPAKKCSLGPYMTQSGPNHDLCKSMWNSAKGREQIAKYTCLNGQCAGADGMAPPGKYVNPAPGNPFGTGLYNGMPLHFKRTPMSNALWQNEMCSPPILQKNHPSVL